MSECVLNLLNGNIKLTGCSKRNLRKHKVALRKVAEKRVPLCRKKKFIIQGGGFLFPLLSAILPKIASLIFRPSYKNKWKNIMLRKISLVSADRFNQPSTSRPSAAQPKVPFPKKKKRQKQKKREHSYEKWVKYR